MKKLLVSDYDGVIKVNNKTQFKNNLIQIRNYLNKSNFFAIATGRVFDSIFPEVKKYNIDFNYIACANSNIIFDKDWNILFKANVSQSFENIILSNFHCFDYIIGKDAYGNISNSDIVEYELRYVNKIAKGKIMKVLLDEKDYEYYHDGEDRLTLHIFNSFYNKLFAVNFISNILKVNSNNIFTIGDGKNDVCMVMKNNGFCIENSQLSNENCALAEYESLGDFIVDINKNLVKRRNRNGR